MSDLVALVLAPAMVEDHPEHVLTHTSAYPHHSVWRVIREWPSETTDIEGELVLAVLAPPPPIGPFPATAEPSVCQPIERRSKSGSERRLQKVDPFLRGLTMRLLRLATALPRVFVFLDPVVPHGVSFPLHSLRAINSHQRRVAFPVPIWPSRRHAYRPACDGYYMAALQGCQAGPAELDWTARCTRWGQDFGLLVSGVQKL